MTLLGPTASGKTELALQLAERMDVSLISVDSAMVYRGLDIGTAKPDKHTLNAYPHALIDVRDPEQSFSVQTFCEEADAAVAEALSVNRLPVLVGGSMMYFRAFREGLAQLPSADQDVRREIRQFAEQSGLEAVHKELKQVDPESAKVINPNNLKRMERALEIYRLTGIPMTTLWRERAVPKASTRLDCELIECVMPDVPRLELHERIEHRLRTMFAAGFINEVQTLRNRPKLTAQSLSMRSVGYREVWSYLENGGEDEPSDALFHKVLVATRRLARKQLTWLRQWQFLNFTQVSSVAVMISRLQR